MSRRVELEITSKNVKVDMDSLLSGVQDASITCSRFELSGVAPTDPRSGAPKGTREYAGITIEKRLDSASTALLELFTNHVGFKAVFKVHKVNASADLEGNQLALQVTIGGTDDAAWVSSYKLIVPDAEKRAGDDPQEPYEIVTFSFANIEFHKSGLNNAGAMDEKTVADSLVGKR